MAMLHSIAVLPRLDMDSGLRCWEIEAQQNHKATINSKHDLPLTGSHIVAADGNFYVQS